MPRKVQATYNPTPRFDRAIATLDGTIATVQEMVDAGTHETPSLRLAVWGCILSSRNSLAANAAQLHQLRPFAMGGLPSDVTVVEAILRESGYPGGMLHSKAALIIKADAQIATGEYDSLLVKPSNLDEWHTWRIAATKLAGIMYKTASMMAMLLWPFDSPLIPCDSHVATRFGLRALYDSGELNKKYDVYVSVERLVLDEHAASGATVSPVIWHWYKWSQWRQATDAETPSVRPESHALLSPYRY